MSGKKPVKAEHDNPPPLLAAKRTLRSAMTAQINVTDPVPSDQEKLNKKSFLAAPRALMDKEGFLKMEERITAESLYTAYKLIFERYGKKLPPDAHKIMLAFKAFLGVFAAEQNAARCRGKLLWSVDRSVRLGRLGVCPECLMAEVGKRLDYNEVRITERWINTQGESACQALKGKGRKGLYKVFQPKRMRCRDSTKYAQRECIGDVAEALQSIQQGPSDTRSQSYRLLAKLSSLIY
jgi:hypothetical protein